jgi:SAM-dependent methyltransferase
LCVVRSGSTEEADVEPSSAAADQWAARSAQRQHDAYLQFFSPVTEHFLPWVGERLPPEARQVVDVGSGGGDLASLIRGQGRRCAAVDNSLLMTDACRRRGIPAAVADAARLPIADGAMDAAVAAFLLPHVPDLGAHFAEVHRIVRPGGIMIQLTWAGSEASPFTGLASSLLARVAPGPVRERLEIASRCTDPRYLTAAAIGAGFGQLELETVSFRTRLESAGVWWRGMIEASIGLSQLIRQVEPADRLTVREEFLHAAGAFSVGDRLAVPVTAHLLQGYAV